jgi:hypothetical protein
MPVSGLTFAELLGQRRKHSPVHLDTRDGCASTGCFEARRGAASTSTERTASAGATQMTRSPVSRGVMVRRAQIVSEPVSECIRRALRDQRADRGGEDIR